MADSYEREFMGADRALFVERIQNWRIWPMMAAGLGGAILGGLSGLNDGMILPGLVALGLATVYCGGLGLFFAFVRTAVTRDHLQVQIGMFGPKIPISAITSAKRVERAMFERSYAGVGKEYVRIAWTAGSRTRTLLLGTNDAAGLVDAIERARGGGAPVAHIRVEDPDAAAATAAAIAEAEADAEKAVASEKSASR